MIVGILEKEEILSLGLQEKMKSFLLSRNGMRLLFHLEGGWQDVLTHATGETSLDLLAIYVCKVV